MGEGIRKREERQRDREREGKKVNQMVTLT